MNRRALLLGTASVVALSTLPSGATTALTVPSPTANAMQTVVEGVRSSLLVIQRELQLGYTRIEEFGVPNLQQWLDSIQDTDALIDLMEEHLAKVHARIRASGYEIISSLDYGSEMNAFAQLLYIQRLPWSPQQAGFPEFFDALLELAPDDLKSRRRS